MRNESKKFRRKIILPLLKPNLFVFFMCEIESSGEKNVESSVEKQSDLEIIFAGETFYVKSTFLQKILFFVRCVNCCNTHFDHTRLKCTSTSCFLPGEF